MKSITKAPEKVKPQRKAPQDHSYSHVTLEQCPPSARRLLDYLVIHANEGGWVTGRTAGHIAADVGITRRQLYRARRLLQRSGFITWFARNGSPRGVKIVVKPHKRAIRELFRNALPKPNSETCDIQYKVLKDIKKNNLKNDPCRTPNGGVSSRDERRWCIKSPPSDYPPQGANRVILVKGARFYRHVMKSIRLELERYVPDISDTVEGALGDLINGRSLSFAREAFSRIIAHLRYIAAAAKRLSQKSLWLLCRAVALGVAKFFRTRLRKEERKERDDMPRKTRKEKDFIPCRVCGKPVDVRNHVDFCHFSCYRRELCGDECPREEGTNVRDFAPQGS